MICECHKVIFSDSTTHKYLCQNKVNDSLMTMKEYYNICKHIDPPVEISTKEFKRLEKLWNERGYEFYIDEKTKEIIFV